MSNASAAATASADKPAKKKSEKMREKFHKENLEKGRAFLEEKKKEEGVYKRKSGLR